MTLRDQTATPTPIPLPDRSKDVDHGSGPTSSDEAFRKPRLRLIIHDLDHPGAAKFLRSVNTATVLSTAVNNVLRLLYKSPSDRNTTCPPTRSVTLVLKSMDGVAFTTGTDLDDDHKEIHFSLDYINSQPSSRLTPEITGVLTHELVHCFQYDAEHSCPGGLIEGIADWVRLKCDLSPPHWKRVVLPSDRWDAGYEKSAYFLDYLQGRFGEGTVRQINNKLRQGTYKADTFWFELVGQSVETLFDDYVEKSKDKGDGDL